MKFFHFKFSIPSTSIANMKRERLIKFSRKKNSRKNLFLPHPNKNKLPIYFLVFTFSLYSFFVVITFSLVFYLSSSLISLNFSCKFPKAKFISYIIILTFFSRLLHCRKVSSNWFFQQQCVHLQNNYHSYVFLNLKFAS